MNLKDEEVAAELRHIQKDPARYWGICSNLSTNIGDFEPAHAWLGHAFSELGVDPDYPVPHPTRPSSAAYDSTDNKWCGPYGENRKYLLETLIRLAEGVPPSELPIVWPHPYNGESDESERD